MATGEFSKFALILTSLVTQTVKRMPAIALWETRVRSLGQEDPLEEDTTTHSSILSWRILWTEEAGRLQSMGHKESDTTERLTLNLKLIESKKRIKIIVHDHVFS